jgi:hypothetical protein
MPCECRLDDAGLEALLRRHGQNVDAAANELLLQPEEPPLEEPAGAHRSHRRFPARNFEPVDLFSSNLLRMPRARAHGIEPHAKIRRQTLNARPRTVC